MASGTASVMVTNWAVSSFGFSERRNVINKPLSDYVLVANAFDEVIRLVE